MITGKFIDKKIILPVGFLLSKDTTLAIEFVVVKLVQREGRKSFELVLLQKIDSRSERLRQRLGYLS
jgi:hypothetical protein